MTMRSPVPVIGLAAILLSSCGTGPQPVAWTPLFPQDGVPAGWSVRAWDDVQNPAPPEAKWRVEGGVLRGSVPRGTWLVSDREYGDFVLEYEFKLGERGNSGCGLRFPLKGDPAFDAIEVQMADLRYNPQAKDSELTGGLYRALAPKSQVYKPTEWNQMQIALKGSCIQVTLNGVVIQDVDLAQQAVIVKRHDGTDAPPLKDRPRRGHIGFQELSRGGDSVQIRNARIQALN